MSRRPKFPRHPSAPGLYVLRDRKALRVDDLLRWGEWFESSDRIVKQTLFRNADPWKRADLKEEIQAERRRREWTPSRGRQNIVDLRFNASQILVSTVFLGMDHSFGGGKPMIFESMVFNGPLRDEMRRYTTWEEAEVGHAELVELTRAALSGRVVPEELDPELAGSFNDLANQGSAAG